MGTQTWVWTGATNIFSFDSNLTGTMTVTKGTTPTDFAASAVISVRMEVSVVGSLFSDDTWTTTRDYRIATAVTGSIGAAVNGTDQSGLGNTTDSTDLTDSSPNTSLTIADWEGMEVYGGDADTEDIWATYVVNMMTDGGLLQVIGATGITITITYNVPVSIVHTTDARTGTFQSHTTDAILFEFDRPENTNLGHTGTSNGRRTVVRNGIVWMVGLESGGEPDTIRLWEGIGGPTVGNWVLHEFMHGTGTNMVIRDLSMAEVNGIIHIVYLHHNYGGGGTIRLYHIEFDPDTGDFTDNGAFGTGESHPTSSVSLGATCAVIATDDDELVATSRMFNFLSFGGSTAYRSRHFTYRSDTQSFSSSTANLHNLKWGPNTFAKPIVESAGLSPSGNDVYVERIGTQKAKFDSSEVESKRFGIWELQTSVWYTRIGGGTSLGREWWLHDQGRIYRTLIDSGASAIVGITSAKAGEVPLSFDDYHLLSDGSQAGIHQPFLDHYGHVGVYVYFSTPDDGVVFLWNGVDAFNSFTVEYGTTDVPNDWYVAPELVERTLSVWKYNSSSQWIDLGVTIPTWFIAHTTDAILLDASGDGQVYHGTDAVLAKGAYGTSFGSATGGGRIPQKSGTKYYTALDSNPKINIFEATDQSTPGILLTEWDEIFVGDVLFSWDFIVVSGILHFAILVWDQGLTRHEVRHSEYNIGSDTWTHNGSFHNTSTDDHTNPKNVAINVRADGDIVVIYGFAASTIDWFYSINTGAGFSTGTSLGFGGFGAASIAVDNNDFHFIIRDNADIEHWRLSPTDVLGTQQTASNVLENIADQFPGAVHPLVASGVMYVAGIDSQGRINELYVTDAATGSDAPTWTKTLVTTTRIAGSSFNLCWFFLGLGGVPTFVYVEQATWKVFKTHLDAGSWIEVDTGLVLEVVAADVNEGSPDQLQVRHYSYSVDAIDTDNFFVGWWKRGRKIQEGNLELDIMWQPLRANINPTAFHSTDAVLELAVGQTINIGVLAETNSLISVGVDVIKAIGILAETNSLISIGVVLPGGQIVTVGTLTQVEALLAISSAKTATISTLAEVETLLAISPEKFAPVGTLAETDQLIALILTLDASTTIILQVNVTDLATLTGAAPARGLGLVKAGNHRSVVYRQLKRVYRK